MPDSTPPSEIPPNTVVLRFEEDHDDRHQELEAEARLVQAIPRKGEVVGIEHQFHAVTEVVHNYDANGIEVHLGPSAETPAEAQDKTQQDNP